MKYSVLLIDDSGKGSYLSVRDKTKFCKTTATKHYNDIKQCIDNGKNIWGAVVVHIEDEFGNITK